MSILAVINHVNCKLKGNELRDVCFIQCYTVDKNLSIPGMFLKIYAAYMFKKIKTVYVSFGKSLTNSENHYRGQEMCNEMSVLFRVIDEISLCRDVFKDILPTLKKL